MNFIKYKKQLWIIKNIRKLSGRTNLTRNLHKFIGLSLLLLIIYSILSEESLSDSIVIYIIIPISAITFIIEYLKPIRIINKKLKKIPNSWSVKILYSLIVAVLTVISTIIAKQIVHNITGVNPVYYFEFLVLLSIIVTIYLIFILMQIAVAIILFNYMILAMLFSIGMYFSIIINLFIEPFNLNTKIFSKLVIRILSGNKQNTPGFLRSLYSFSMFLGAVSLFYILSYPAQLIANESNTLNHLTRELLVLSEYRKNSRCQNISKDTGVVYLHKNYISIARRSKNTNEYDFEVGKCFLLNK